MGFRKVGSGTGHDICDEQSRTQQMNAVIRLYCIEEDTELLYGRFR